MNRKLLNEIVKHVFANLLVIPSGHVDIDRSKSLRSKDYLLKDKISFQLEDGNNVLVDVWGCQLSSDIGNINMLLADCTDSSYYEEYVLLVDVEGAPTYGAYLVIDDSIDETLLAFTMDGSSWLECDTYFQSMFLAGMEQLKQGGLSWKKCKDYTNDLDLLSSFIKFHLELFGEE